VALCNTEGQPCRVFEQGETASFFFEFELLQDIEVPIGGVVIQSDKGVTVHGKSTLEHGSEVPCGVAGGTRLRFRQNVTLEIAVGEYTFLVGLAAISAYDYELRRLYSHPDLHTKIVRLCHLPAAGQFAVVFRRNGAPVQLLHHGAANLPGDCHVLAEPPVA
jgi:lipopolysaccharide transport system ATP-binding protein